MISGFRIRTFNDRTLIIVEPSEERCGSGFIRKCGISLRVRIQRTSSRDDDVIVFYYSS